MKQVIVALILLTSVTTTFGAKEKQKKVPYKVANNYFVKNTVADEVVLIPKITSQEVFDQLFGAAPLMGKKGLPTAIDFSKQFVIAFIDQSINQHVTLGVKSIRSTEEQISVHFSRKSTGEQLSAVYRSAIILIVDKTHEKSVELVCEETDSKSIPMRLSANYFVNNTVENKSIILPQISSSEELENYFGMAPLMGEDGKPTEIDFTNEFVLAVIDSAINQLPNNLAPVALTSTKGKLTFLYTRISQPISASEFRYFLMLVVPNEYKSNATLLELK